MLNLLHQKHVGVLAHGRSVLSKRHHGQSSWGHINAWNGNAGHQSGIERRRENMGIDWMTGSELAQAIPPAFTEFIGKQLIAALSVAP